MKKNEKSMKTKQALAASLKKEMMRKPLSKITIKELIEDCSINRKTFYYHFEDIYALMKWMLEQEAVEVVKQFDLMANPEEAIRFVLDYVETNRHILNCAYDSIGRDGLKRFLYQDFISIMGSIVDECEGQLGIAVDGDFKQLLSGFYAEACAGALINVLQNREAWDREAVTRDILLIFQSSIPAILTSKVQQSQRKE
ncbi:MAG: TetR/AcrR family transcriptional regulator C-terminal domain-containing protein [Anaerovoracaceae bacterium]